MGGQRRGPRRSRHGERGQGLVEVAIVLPVFFLVLVAVFDAGRLVFTSSTISQAAREGARLAATEAAWIGVPSPRCVPDESAIGSSNPGAQVCPVDVSAFKSHVISAINRMAVTAGPISAVHISCNAGDAGDPAPTGDWTEASGGNGCQDGSGNPVSTSGDIVSVRIEHMYLPMTPVINSIVGSVPMSGSATMVIH